MTIMNIITQKARKSTQTLYMMQSLLQSLLESMKFGSGIFNIGNTHLLIN